MFSLARLLSSAILMASAQRSYDLTFSRPYTDINRILLVCVDASNGKLVLDASFFRNGALYNNLPRKAVTNTGVVLVVDHATEGNFTCGEQRSTSVPPRVCQLPNYFKHACHPTLDKGARRGLIL